MMQSLMYASIKRARGAPDPVSPTKEKRTDSCALLIFQNERGASKQAPPFLRGRADAMNEIGVVVS